MPIYFNVKEAREYLFNHKMVYILSSGKKTEGITQIRKSKDKGLYPFELIGYVKVTFVKEILNPYDLKDYFMQSGFGTVTEWLDKAGESRFLHKVELTE